MPRARNIKPAFYANEQLAECSFQARLLFPALWMLADRRGLLEDRTKWIKAFAFPYDSVEVEPLLEELKSQGLISRYSSQGMKCIHVITFCAHQNPHKREPENKCPVPGKAATKRGQHPAGPVQTGTGPAESLLLNPSSLNPESPIPPSGGGTVLPFESEGFKEAWSLWTQHRIEKRKPLTKTSTERQFATFKKWGEARSIAAIMFSIEKGWQGIYEDVPFRNNGNGQAAQRTEYAKRTLLDALKEPQCQAKSQEELPR